MSAIDKDIERLFAVGDSDKVAENVICVFGNRRAVN